MLDRLADGCGMISTASNTQQRRQSNVPTSLSTIAAAAAATTPLPITPTQG